MATSELPTRATPNIDAVTNLANLFLGKETNTTGSKTEQNSGGISTNGTVTTTDSTSPEAVQALVKSILEGSNGLAAVSSGQKRAGLYNSSTNELLQNDLIARTAAEGAKLNKSTTVATNNTQMDNRAVTSNSAGTSVTPAQISPKAGLTGLGLLQLGSLVPQSIKTGIASKLGLGDAATKQAATSIKTPSDGSDPTETDVSQYMASHNDSMDPTSNIAGATGIGTSLDTQSISGLTALDQSFQGGGYGDEGFVFDGAGVGAAVTDAGVGAADTGSFGGDAGTDAPVDSSGINLDFNSGNVIDAGNMNDLADADFGGWFADGGLVSVNGKKNNGDEGKKESIFDRRNAALDAAEDAAVKGGSADDAYKQRMDTQSKSEKKGNFVTRLLSFADGGVVRLKDAARENRNTTSKAVGRNDPSIRQQRELNISQATIQNPDLVKTIQEVMGVNVVPGYAKGGVVDLTNLGLRTQAGAEETPLGIAGDTVAISPRSASASSGDSAHNTVRNDGGTSAAGAVKPNIKVRQNPDAGGSGDANGPGAGTTPGATGSGIGIGTTAASVGMNAIGIGAPGLAGLATATNNSQAVTAAVTGIASAISPALGLLAHVVMSNMNAPESLADAAAVASSQNSAPTQSDQDAALANALAADTDTDPLDALVGIVSDPSVTNTSDSSDSGSAPGEGGGVGGTGASAGDAGDSGADGSGSGGASASAASGGKIEGPGTATSDSILAHLSDGEYVHKAKSVQLFGEDFMDAVNDGDPQGAMVAMLKKGLIGGTKNGRN